MKLLTMGSFLLIVAQLTSAPAAKAQEPEPGPEIQRLAYYLGSWRGEGETKGGPFGPAGKLSSSSSCEWFAASVDGGAWAVIAEGKVTKIK